MTHKAYLLTGGNLGNRAHTLAVALKLVHDRLGEVLDSSRMYETAPWGFNHETPFLNQALLVETKLTPHELLEGILGIEQEMGRVRDGAQWKERLIDIDVLFYDDLIVNDTKLRIPHPYLQERRFALVPLADIDSSLVHPVLKKTVKQMIIECPDPLEVKPYA
jgi:2-amino-4-hydroxy-6-hydroxymethyldihydropteridine diphosphokinase